MSLGCMLASCLGNHSAFWEVWYALRAKDDAGQLSGDVWFWFFVFPLDRGTGKETFVPLLPLW